MSDKKYVLTFRHMDIFHPRAEVAVKDTLEEAQASFGIGNGLIKWSKISDGVWVGDTEPPGGLQFVYYIHYQVPPQSEPVKPLPFWKRVLLPIFQRFTDTGELSE